MHISANGFVDDNTSIDVRPPIGPDNPNYAISLGLYSGANGYISLQVETSAALKRLHDAIGAVLTDEAPPAHSG